MPQARFSPSCQPAVRRDVAGALDAVEHVRAVAAGVGEVGVGHEVLRVGAWRPRRASALAASGGRPRSARSPLSRHRVDVDRRPAASRPTARCWARRRRRRRRRRRGAGGRRGRRITSGRPPGDELARPGARAHRDRAAEAAVGHLDRGASRGPAPRRTTRRGQRGRRRRSRRRRGRRPRRSRRHGHDGEATHVPGDRPEPPGSLRRARPQLDSIPAVQLPAPSASNAATTPGSNCVPAPARISPAASSTVQASL